MSALVITASLAQFLFALDMSVVNVALPAIGSDLGFTPVGLSWVVHAYALAFGGCLLLGGRASDVYGRRRLLLTGLVVFGISSLLGGVAPAPWLLLAARAGQGFGAAAAAPAALALLTTALPLGPERLRALGIWSAANASGGALGVIAGGLITQVGGWRGVMFVSVPLAALAIVLVIRVVTPDLVDGSARQIDVLGAVLATGGVGAVVLGVIRSESLGWTSPATLATLCGGLVALFAFVMVERRVTTPLLRLGILRSRWVAGANAIVFFAAAGQFAAFYFISLYLQQVLMMSPLATGAAFLPFSAGVVVGSMVATRVSSVYTVRHAIIPGALLAAVGMLWFAQMTPGSRFVSDVLGPTVVTSLGVGLVLAPVVSAATRGVAGTEAGTASGLVNSTRQLGGSIGLAVLATVASVHTGPAASGASVGIGYTAAMRVSAVFFAVAAAIAAIALPRGASGRTRL